MATQLRLNKHSACGQQRRWVKSIAVKIGSLLLLPLFALGAMAGPAQVLRSAETQPLDYPTAQALTFMAEQLQEWSQGELNIKLYTGGQLGDEKDTLELTILGGIDLNRVNLAPLNSIVPETIVFGMPFLFRSIAHMRAVVDGPIGDEILAAMEAHGLVGLAFYDSGARSFYNNVRPIRTPKDLKGLKIRVQNSDLYVSMVAALGANPTPMGFGQVYESLLLGTIDGSENNWPSYETTGHYEAAPFYSLTEHTMTPEVLVVSKHRWDKLSPEHQVLLKRAAKASVPFMRAQWDLRTEKSRQKIIAAGVTVAADVDKAAFEAAVQPVYDRFIATPELRALIARIRAVEPRPKSGI
ncbi:TRAP transporter substrate-binding protein [Pseudomaricurvus alcaniphilus]|uniref:TRAP transporter substrate-binding protein n=1 Tax=Pseudomaricurvus alcaniphilus TaxID=1166482 RepID=UPI00140B35A9|nr:TRAP transporter substrate-binding protein [Pseudomaricurvus alcaniphilus]NHN35784.1 TRAP transporter substrate-binding protein [Pseudomaricurvus alcaniphilus]